MDVQRSQFPSFWRRSLARELISERMQMALRMAQDLGLHQDVHRHRKEVGEQQRASDTLLWWSCFILDRALAIGTGRSVTVKDNEISVSCSSFSTMIPS